MKKREIILKLAVELGLPALGLALQALQSFLSGKQADEEIRKIVRDEINKSGHKKRAKYVEVKY